MNPQPTPGALAQFINVEILDSLRPKILLALAQAKTATVGASLGETSSAYDGGSPGLSNSFAYAGSLVPLPQTVSDSLRLPDSDSQIINFDSEDKDWNEFKIR